MPHFMQKLLTVKLQNEFLPFLYPNQYVDFSVKSEACTLAQSLVKDGMNDVEILKLFIHMSQNISPTITIRQIL